jgi:hypothetical protein
VRLKLTMRKDRKGAAYLNDVQPDDTAQMVPADEIF